MNINISNTYVLLAAPPRLAITKISNKNSVVSTKLLKKKNQKIKNTVIFKPRFWMKHNELQIVTLKNHDPDILDHLFQIMCLSEKHPDFEIEPVNTIQPLEIEYTQTPQALVPIDTPLSIIHKHIPRQSDIDKIVRNIETCVIHSLELPIQAQDLVKVYQTSTHFHDIYQYITDGKLPSSSKAQNCIRAKALN